MFAATWLSYVGFYFCRVPFSKAKAAIGETAHWGHRDAREHLVGVPHHPRGRPVPRVADGPRLGPRRNVLLGMAVSITVTLAMGVTLSWQVMTGLVAINGLAQATRWSGNVGTMASWFHKHERGQIMELWLATFAAATISGFGSLGAVVQELLISHVYHPKQDGLIPIFAMLFGSAALAATFCGTLVWRNRQGGKGI